VVQVPGAEYEIGLIKRDGKYVPAWDWYYRGGLQNVLPENGMAGFLQAYAVEAARLTAQRQGQFCSEKTLQDGTVEIRVQIEE
jgi:hypothetical protein